MIISLELAFGSSSVKSKPLVFNPGAVTVFVGANNSGKSLILREIYSALFDLSAQQHYLPVNLPGWISPEKRKIVRELQRVEQEWSAIRPLFERLDRSGTVFLGSLLEHHHPGGHLSSSELISGIENQDRPELLAQARTLARRSQVAFIDGRERLTLVDPLPAGNLKQAPTNHLQALFQDDAKRNRLRRMIFDAFGSYFVIDPTNTGTLSPAMSADLPATTDQERCLSEDSISFFSRAKPMAELSDGVKAYTGILSAVLSSELKTLLIDEPDAFLHPPLARRLGSTLTALARRGRVTCSRQHTVQIS